MSVVYLVLSLCALATTSAAAILWTPIDADFITRADNAGSEFVKVNEASGS
ncbi:hypothetical protein ABIB27_001486 [Arthrobacter sp. UYEF21]